MAFNIVFANFAPIGSINKSFVSNEGMIKNTRFTQIHLRENTEALNASFYADKKRLKIGEHYLFSTPTADAILYLEKAQNPQKRITPPFQFRILYPYIVHMVEKIKLKTGLIENISFLSCAKTFWVLNLVFLSLSMIILFKIFEHFNINNLLKYVGISAFLTQIAIIRTAPFPLIDTMVYFMFLTCFYLLIKEKWYELAFFLVLSVLTKEVFIIFAPALICKFFEDKKKQNLYLAFITISVFILQRFLDGSDILSASIGWNISRGEFNLKYFVAKFGTTKKALNYIISLIAAHGIFFIYLPNAYKLKKNGLFFFFVSFFTLLNIAIIFLSSTVTRNAAMLTPIFILLGLLSIKQQKNKI
jgi:hypothetical protein